LSNGASKQPELIDCLAQLKYQNDLMDDVTISIKEKLRSISKFELPPCPVDPNNSNEPSINSAIDEFKHQIRRKKQYNERLSEILMHLKEII
jgi:hypothetical protein